MSVLNRRLFNRGGRVSSSRGVGITSGLVPSYAHGGLHEEAGGDVIKDRFKSNMEMFRELDLIPERKPFNKFQNIAPAALDFFGGLMSGKSMQGGLGGGLEIAGESLKSASPLFAEALKNKQEYDATDPESALKNLALGEALKPDPTPNITGTQVIDFVDPVDKKTKQKLVFFKDGVLEEEVLGLLVGDEATAVKSIPRDVYDTLNKEQRLKILGLDGENGITNVGSPVDILNEAGEMQSVVTYVQNNELKTKVLGAAPDDAKTDSQVERMIKNTDLYVGKNISENEILRSNYPEIFPEGTYTIDTSHIEKLKNALNFKYLKQEIEGDPTPSAEELQKLKDIEFLRTTVTTPAIDSIRTDHEKASSRAVSLTGAKSAIKSFTPGSFADTRLEVGKLLSLVLDPKTLSQTQINLLENLKIGNTGSGDVLSKLGSQLTLSQAAGGAIPGNLNLSEFNEIKNTGLPLWTSQEGAELMIEIYLRQDEIAFAQKRMLDNVNSDLVEVTNGSKKEFTIQYPNGEIKAFDNYESAISAIENLKGDEGKNIISGGSEVFTEWNSIADKLENVKKYDVDSLRLENKMVKHPFKNEETSALELEKEGLLKFVGWGDGKGNPGEPNVRYFGQAIYEYDTGMKWKEETPGYDPKKHIIGASIKVFWASPKSQAD